MPEGSSDDDSDQEGLPDEQEDDDPKCPTPADIFRSRTEDLGGNIQTR